MLHPRTFRHRNLFPLLTIALQSYRKLPIKILSFFFRRLIFLLFIDINLTLLCYHFSFLLDFYTGAAGHAIFVDWCHLLLS